MHAFRKLKSIRFILIGQTIVILTLSIRTKQVDQNKDTKGTPRYIYPKK